MTKRRQTEIAFGSDAFLDVIANIVGILIILIVVAGVKVGRAPLRAPALLTAQNVQRPGTEMTLDLPQPAVPMAVPEPLVEPDPTPAEQLSAPASAEGLSSLIPTEQAVEPEPVAMPPVELPPLPTLRPAEPPQELVSQFVELEVEVGALQNRLSSVSDEVTREQTRTTSLAKSLDELKTQAAAIVTSLHQRQAKLTEVEAKVRERQQRLSLLSEVLENRQELKPPVESLEHRLTPVGQSVEGDEIHFRLEGNRVSYVPIMELAQLVKSDMERHKEILLTRSFYKGTVGARHGYRMEYLVQREARSLAEEFRNGSGVVRVLVTQWIIVPDKSLETESLEEALRPESNFVSALRQAKGKVTVTLWVYPDSFGLHQKLKEAIHEAGLSVASRPLPKGVPIAGSPDGTKSVSQ